MKFVNKLVWIVHMHIIQNNTVNIKTLFFAFFKSPSKKLQSTVRFIMSQLFTLQFPKYHFDKQSEFTINFPDARNLPFSYDITNGMVCIDEIIPPSKEQERDAAYMKQRRLWMNQGLQEGVRIISITNKNLTNEHDASKLAYLTRQVVDEIIREHTNRENQIEITFREEILEFDDSISLGLEYNPDNGKQSEAVDEDKWDPLSPSRKSFQVLGIHLHFFYLPFSSNICICQRDIKSN